MATDEYSANCKKMDAIVHEVDAAIDSTLDELRPQLAAEHEISETDVHGVIATRLLHASLRAHAANLGCGEKEVERLTSAVMEVISRKVKQ